MKKFLILIIILFSYNLYTFAQNSYQIEFGDTLHNETIINSIGLNDGSAIFVGFCLPNHNTNTQTKKGLIIKTDSLGNTSDILNFTKSDTNIKFFTIERWKDHYIIVGTTSLISNPNNENLFLLHIDSNFSIISENIIVLSDTLEMTYQWIYANIFENGKLYINGYRKFIPGNFIYSFITKINIKDNLINNYHRFEQYGTCFHARRKNEDSIILFMHCFPYYSLGQLALLDTNLNVISIDSIPNNVANVNYSVSINDSTYLLTGINYKAQKEKANNNSNLLNFYEKWDMGILLMNNKNEKLKFLSFGKYDDTLDIPGMYKNIDYVYKDAIYYGGTCNFNMGYWPGEQRPFMLIKMDSNVNVIWQKFYLTESCNELNSVLATHDGGCVLMGKKINFPATLDYDANAVIIKVDADGNFVGINKKEKIQIAAQEAIVYPNPCLDVIHTRIGVHIKSTTFFSLYNLNGTKVLTKNIQQNYDQISISSLSAGVYIYEFENNGKIIGKGKIIKQN